MVDKNDNNEEKKKKSSKNIKKEVEIEDIKNQLNELQESKNVLEQRNKLLSEQVNQLNNTIAHIVNAHKDKIKKLESDVIKKFALAVIEIKDCMDELNQREIDYFSEMQELKGKNKALWSIFNNVQTVARMTNAKFSNVLLMFNIKEIESKEGTKCDEERHQVVISTKVENTKGGLIYQVIKKGYTINEEILRHTLVVATEEN